jgi:hypothetical protein
MFLKIEPLSMPTLKRSFQRESKEVAIRPSLDVDSAANLAVGSTRLVLEK